MKDYSYRGARGKKTYKPYENNENLSPEQETSDRIINLMFKINTQHFQTELPKLSVQIQQEYVENRDLVLATFRNCIYQVPYLISIYATLTGLLGVDNFEIASDFIKTAADVLNEGLETSSFRKVKLIVYCN